MKQIFAIIFMFVILFTIFGCANKGALESSSAESPSTPATTAPAESYDPVLVDNLTSDLDQITW